MQIFTLLLLVLCLVCGVVKGDALTHTEFFKKWSSDGLKSDITNTGNIVKVGCRPGTVRVRGQCRQLWQ